MRMLNCVHPNCVHPNCVHPNCVHPIGARRLGRWIAPLMLVVLLATVAAACPTCSEGLAGSDPHHRSIAAGFYYSIIFMMSMPYLLLSSLGCLAYVSIRRAKLRQDAADGAELASEADLPDQASR
jgi:hypothetical protein